MREKELRLRDHFAAMLPKDKLAGGVSDWQKSSLNEGKRFCSFCKSAWGRFWKSCQRCGHGAPEAA